MAEKPDEVKKLITIASDLELASEVRTKAIEAVGNVSTHEALLALLGLAANEALFKEERELAIKHARKLIKSGH